MWVFEKFDTGPSGGASNGRGLREKPGAGLAARDAIHAAAPEIFPTRASLERRGAESGDVA